MSNIASKKNKSFLILPLLAFFCAHRESYSSECDIKKNTSLKDGFEVGQTLVECTNMLPCSITIVMSYLGLKSWKSWKVGDGPVQGVAFNYTGDTDAFKDVPDDLLATSCGESLTVWRNGEVAWKKQLPRGTICNRNNISMLNGEVSAVVRELKDDWIYCYTRITSDSESTFSESTLLKYQDPPGKYNSLVMQPGFMAWHSNMYENVPTYFFNGKRGSFRIKNVHEFADIRDSRTFDTGEIDNSSLAKNSKVFAYVRGHHDQNIVTVVDRATNKVLAAANFNKETELWDPTQIALSHVEKDAKKDNTLVALLASYTGELRLYRNYDFSKYILLRQRYAEGFEAFRHAENPGFLSFTHKGRHLVEQSARNVVTIWKAIGHYINSACNDFGTERLVPDFYTRLAEPYRIQTSQRISSVAISKNDAIAIGDVSGDITVFEEDDWHLGRPPKKPDLK